MTDTLKLQFFHCWLFLGIVTVAGRVDYESVQAITFTVRVSDGADEGIARTTDQRFSVSVININDNKPQFSQEYYEAEISENTTDRQTVTTVTATDADLSPYGEVRYWYSVVLLSDTNTQCLYCYQQRSFSPMLQSRITDARLSLLLSATQFVLKFMTQLFFIHPCSFFVSDTACQILWHSLESMKSAVCYTRSLELYLIENCSRRFRFQW